MDRVQQLEEMTKDYFIESDEFLFAKKFINKKKKVINLVFSAYNVEYNLILKDYRIFFENKLKTKFSRDTILLKTENQKKFRINKFFLISRKLKNFRFVDKNFDYRDIAIKPNVVIKFKVNRKKKQLRIKKLKSKVLTRRFFFDKLLELGDLNLKLKLPFVLKQK